jgi:DNA-binding protein H-NS
MALKETIHQMRQYLIALTHDLEKAAEGNRAAAQRVRTASIHFAKITKTFRKESVAAERVPKKGGKSSRKAVPKKRR